MAVAIGIALALGLLLPITLRLAIGLALTIAPALTLTLALALTGQGCAVRGLESQFGFSSQGCVESTMALHTIL